MSGARLARAALAQGPSDSELLAQLPIPALLVDAAGRVARANGAAEEALGLSAAAMRARGLPRPLAQLARRGGAVRAHGIEIEAAPGPLRADVAIEPVAGRTGWLVLTIAPRALEPPAPPARLAPGLAAMLAHEIKNPLAGIRGAAQLLGQDAGAEARELTALITSEVDRVARLVTRLERLTDPAPVRLAPVNLHEVLTHVRRLGEGLAPQIMLREAYDPSLPMIHGNRDQLVQLFLNLVKNAVEAIAGHGEITLTTAFRHGQRLGGRLLPIEASVADSGPGIPAAILARLFEPFASTKPEGGGLGLAMVARIAADHGAVVEHARLGARTLLRVRFAAVAP